MVASIARAPPRVECVARGGQPFPDCRFGRPSCSVSDETTGSGEGEEDGSRGRGHRVRRSGVSASTRLPVRVARSLPRRCHPRGTRVRKCLGCGKRLWPNALTFSGQLGGFRRKNSRSSLGLAVKPRSRLGQLLLANGTGSASAIASLAREIHGGDAISAASLSSSFARAARTDSRWRPRRPRSGRASPSRGARRAASRARDARRVWRPARPTTTRPPWTCPRMRSATRRGTR